MEINLTAADADVTGKRADMVAFLDSRKQERASARESRRTAMAAVVADEGGAGGGNGGTIASSTEDFWAVFTARSKVLLETMNAAAEAGANSEADALCAKWNAECLSLQALLNDCTRFLPAFDVRKAQQELVTIEETIEATKGKIQPRKKFTFKSRAKLEAKTQALEQQHAAAAAAAAASSASNGKENVVTATSSSSAKGAPSSSSSFSSSSSSSASSETKYDEDEHTIENITGQVIYIPQGQFTAAAARELTDIDARISSLSKSGASVPHELFALRRHTAALAAGKDIRLLNITDCTIIILDPLKAMRVDGLTRCKVYTGPIAGSVLLHRCESCVFMFAARQLRIHTSTLCDYYLRVMSRPIIEHCQQLRFAPYGITYEGSKAAIEVAGLSHPSKADMWRCVDDFGWHRVQKSPNWDVLPKAERMGAIAAAAAVGDETSGDGAGIGSSGIVTAIPKDAIEKGLSIQYGETGEENDPPPAPPTAAVAAAIIASPPASEKKAKPITPAPTAATGNDDEL